jgi:hypothetical protein
VNPFGQPHQQGLALAAAGGAAVQRFLTRQVQELRLPGRGGEGESDWSRAR